MGDLFNWCRILAFKPAWIFGVLQTLMYIGNNFTIFPLCLKQAAQRGIQGWHWHWHFFADIRTGVSVLCPVIEKFFPFLSRGSNLLLAWQHGLGKPTTCWPVDKCEPTGQAVERRFLRTRIGTSQRLLSRAPSLLKIRVAKTNVSKTNVWP